MRAQCGADSGQAGVSTMDHRGCLGLLPSDLGQATQRYFELWVVLKFITISWFTNKFLSKVKFIIHIFIDPFDRVIELLYIIKNT